MAGLKTRSKIIKVSGRGADFVFQYSKVIAIAPLKQFAPSFHENQNLQAALQWDISGRLSFFNTNNMISLDIMPNRSKKQLFCRRFHHWK
jgi:hypothetical protein